MIAPMRVLAAGRALLFDIGNLPVCCDFTVVARDAATTERRETQETDKTHHVDPQPTLSNSCTVELITSDHDSSDEDQPQHDTEDQTC